MKNPTELEPLNRIDRLRKRLNELRGVSGQQSEEDVLSADRSAYEGLQQAETDYPTPEAITQGRQDAGMRGAIGQGISQAMETITGVPQVKDAAQQIRGSYEDSLKAAKERIAALRGDVADRRKGAMEEAELGIKQDAAGKKGSDMRTELDAADIQALERYHGRKLSPEELQVYKDRAAKWGTKSIKELTEGVQKTAGQMVKKLPDAGQFDKYDDSMKSLETEDRKLFTSVAGNISKALKEEAIDRKQRKDLSNLTAQAATNPAAAGSLVSQIARQIAGEKGMLTEGDINRVSGDQTLGNKVKSFFKKYWETGARITPQDLGQAIDLVNSVLKLVPQAAKERMEAATVPMRTAFGEKATELFKKDVLPNWDDVPLLNKDDLMRSNLKVNRQGGFTTEDENLPPEERKGGATGGWGDAPTQSQYTPAQERGIERVMKTNNVSREKAIQALKDAGKL